MPTLPGVHRSAELLSRKVEWAEPMYRSAPPRYLFRGQPARYASVSCLIARFDPWDELAFGQHYTICRYARTGHIGGLQAHGFPPILEDDAVAVLQHYGMRTPFIDLTSDLETALYFAVYDTQPGEHCHLYVLDWKKLPGEYKVVSHEFALGEHPPSNRWTRQKAFSIAPRDWHQATSIRDWDLLNSPAYKAIDRFTFEADHSLLALGPSLLSKASDPLPRLIRASLQSFLSDWESLHPDVANRVAAI
jgi:hypothetical protein